MSKPAHRILAELYSSNELRRLADELELAVHLPGASAPQIDYIHALVSILHRRQELIEPFLSLVAEERPKARLDLLRADLEGENKTRAARQVEDFGAIRPRFGIITAAAVVIALVTLVVVQVLNDGNNPNITKLEACNIECRGCVGLNRGWISLEDGSTYTVPVDDSIFVFHCPGRKRNISVIVEIKEGETALSYHSIGIEFDDRFSPAAVNFGSFHRIEARDFDIETQETVPHEWPQRPRRRARDREDLCAGGGACEGRERKQTMPRDVEVTTPEPPAAANERERRPRRVSDEPKHFCGDGVPSGEEECDDGNVVNDDMCSNICIRAFCGDGIVQRINDEECDDNNANNNDNCTNNCRWFVCPERYLKSKNGCRRCSDGMVFLEGGERAGRTVSPFCVDRKFVSVSEYSACVSSGDCTMPRNEMPGDNWGKPGRESFPVNALEHAQARDYCGFREMRLPSLLERRWMDESGSFYVFKNSGLISEFLKERRFQRNAHGGGEYKESEYFPVNTSTGFRCAFSGD